MNLSHLISQAIAEGRVRRFERGDSGGFDAVQTFLLGHGYKVNKYRNQYSLKQIGKAGRGRILSKAKLMEEVDRIRISSGKEPLHVGNAGHINAQRAA